MLGPARARDVRHFGAEPRWRRGTSHGSIADEPAGLELAF